jgi:hypothetical protein
VVAGILRRHRRDYGDDRYWRRVLGGQVQDGGGAAGGRVHELHAEHVVERHREDGQRLLQLRHELDLTRRQRVERGVLVLRGVRVEVFVMYFQ